MEAPQIVRLAHISIRMVCFAVIMFKLYPILMCEMKRANGYKSQRRNIQAVMIGAIVGILDVAANQVAIWDEPFILWRQVLAIILTLTMVWLTYFGVKMFYFKKPEG